MDDLVLFEVAVVGMSIVYFILYVLWFFAAENWCSAAVKVDLFIVRNVKICKSFCHISTSVKN